jgi:hypothetical protein
MEIVISDYPKFAPLCLFRAFITLYLSPWGLT